MEQVSKRFEFVPHTLPRGTTSSAARHLVRSHALRHHYDHTPRTRRRTNEIELDVTPLLSHGTRAADSEQDRYAETAISRMFISDLDPFFQYPVQMRSREKALYSHRKPSKPKLTNNQCSN